MVSLSAEKLRSHTEGISLYNDLTINSPIDRRGVAQFFRESAPRPVDAVYDVIEQQRERVLADPILVRLLGSLVDTMDSPALEEAVRNGDLTYTMFKPNLGRSTLRPNDVAEQNEGALITEWCREFHDRGCNVLVPVSTVMTPETFEDFYSGNKGWQSGISVGAEAFPEYTVAPDSEEDRTLFEMIKRGMISGVTTPAIVNSVDGDAVKSWRRILGPSNPDKDRDKPEYAGSFRSREVRFSNNTLVHGSGSIEEVIKEIDWYKKRMEYLIRAGVQI